MSDLVGGFACNGCGSSCAYAQGIGYYCTNQKCTYERDQAKAMVEKMHRVADNAGTLAARIQALETSLAEAEGRVIAEVAAWLRAESKLCDCHAREENECACGAWDDYKSKPLLQIAEDLEQGKYK